MNKLRCFVTGGHRFASGNIVSRKDQITKEMVFKRKCIKCGKEFEDRIPEMVFEIGEERMRRRGIDDGHEF